MEFEDYCYIPSKNTQISCSDNQSENDCDLSQFSSTNTTSNFSADFQHQQQHLKQLSHQDLPSQHIPEQQQQQHHLTQEMIQMQQYQQYILYQQQYYYYLQQNQNLIANNQLFQQQQPSQQQQQQHQHFFEFPQQFYQVSQLSQQQSQYQQSPHPQNSCFYSAFQQPQQISSNYFNHTIPNHSSNLSQYPYPQLQSQQQIIPSQNQFVYANNNLSTFLPNNINNLPCQSHITNNNNTIYNQQQQQYEQQQFQIVNQHSNYQQAQGISQKNTRIEAMRRRLTSVDTGKGGEIFRRYLPQRPRASLSF